MIYSFVYAGDVAQALIALIRADRKVDGQAFNITIPQGTTARGFVEACAVVAGRTPRLLSVPLGELGYAMADFDLKDLSFPFPHFHFFAGSAKLREFTGFTPRHTVPAMLKIYHDWWLQRGDLAPRAYPREQALLRRLGTPGR